jgi:hypothetical protein
MTALLDPAILGLVLVAIAYLKPRMTPILTRPTAPHLDK